jgi:hypothetical protein
MPDVAMAMNAGKHFAVLFGRQHLVHDVGVAVQACALRHASIAWLDLNWLVEIFQRKGQRVEKPVVAFYNPFSNRMMGQMAIVTDGDVPMAGVLPGIVMALHDMAVGTCSRVVAQVAPPFAVAERERSDARENSEEHGQEDRQERGTARPFPRAR